MESVFYIGLIFMTVYVGYSLVMQLSKSSERNSSIAKAKTAFDEAENDRISAKTKLFQSIEKAYGKEQAEKVQKGTIWINMPMHLLLVAMGRANSVKESSYKNLRVEKWYYGEYTNRLGNVKYNLEVTLENDKIVGWQDLN